MIKGGVLDARSILNSPSDDWKGAKIAVLLRCMPAVDRQKATTIIRTAKVSPSKTISGLSDDQRRRLLNLMEPYCP
jgi:ribosomal protein S13